MLGKIKRLKLEMIRINKFNRAPSIANNIDSRFELNRFEMLLRFLFNELNNMSNMELSNLDKYFGENCIKNSTLQKALSTYKKSFIRLKQSI